MHLVNRIITDMRIKEGFALRNLKGGHIVVGEGLAQVNFNKIAVLNESATYLWGQVEDHDFDVDELARLLTERYGISPEVAGQDARRWVEKMEKQGFLEA